MFSSAQHATQYQAHATKDLFLVAYVHCTEIHLHAVGRMRHYDDDHDDDEDTATTMTTTMICNSNTRIRHAFPDVD
jgi:hypothetical protein